MSGIKLPSGVLSSHWAHRGLPLACFLPSHSSPSGASWHCLPNNLLTPKSSSAETASGSVQRAPSPKHRSQKALLIDHTPCDVCAHRCIHTQHLCPHDAAPAPGTWQMFSRLLSPLFLFSVPSDLRYQRYLRCSQEFLRGKLRWKILILHFARSPLTPPPPQANQPLLGASLPLPLLPSWPPPEPICSACVSIVKLFE